ncbi:MAG: hypothetical protein Tsb002_13130 [Wenzhouxiangellaceae bacterium]
MIYCFKDVTVDTSARLLTRNGETVAIPKRAFDCLRVLIENSDRAVSRDELIDQIWGHDNISDNQLSQTVLMVRRLIGDDGMKQNLIRTVPGVGYHWHGPVVQKTQPGTDTGQPHKSGPDSYSSVDSEVATHSTNDRTPSESADLAPTPNLSDIHTSESRLPPSATTGNPVQPPRLRLGYLLLSLLAGILLVGYRLHDPASGSTTAQPESSQGSIWVLPAVVDQNSSNAWVPIGLMSLISDSIRLSGLQAVPTELVLSAVNAPERINKGLTYPELQSQFNADVVIHPSASFDGKVWSVHLIAENHDRPDFETSHQDENLIQATIAAADALVIYLGRTPFNPSNSDRLVTTAMNEWFRQGNYQRVREELDKLDSSTRDQLAVRLLEARLADTEGHYQTAMEILDQIFTRDDLNQHPVLHARALLLRVSLERALLLDPDIDKIDLAITLLEQADAPTELAAALFNRGRLKARLGDVYQANLDLVRARELYEQSNELLGVAEVQYESARLMAMSSRYLEAIEELQLIESVFQKYSHHELLARTYQLMIMANTRLLRWPQALELCDKALVIADRVNIPTRERLHRRCAFTFLKTGELNLAEQLLDQIAIDQQAIGTGVKDALILSSLRASLELERGNKHRALRLFEQVIIDYQAIVKKLEQPESQMKHNQETFMQHYMLARRVTGDLSQIDPSLTDILETPISISGKFSKALYLLESDDTEAAEDWLQMAFHSSLQKRSLYDAIAIAEVLIHLMIDQGRLVDARETLNLLISAAPEQMKADYEATLITLRVAIAENNTPVRMEALKRAEALSRERLMPEKLKNRN